METVKLIAMKPSMIDGGTGTMIIMIMMITKRARTISLDWVIKLSILEPPRNPPKRFINLDWFIY